MSDQELKPVVLQALKEGGHYQQIQAQMRSLVYNVLHKNFDNGIENKKNPDLEVVNEIVREYLAWSGCLYAKDVFEHESGLDTSPLPRKQLLEQLGVTDTAESSKLPILIGIVECLKPEIKKP